MRYIVSGFFCYTIDGNTEEEAKQNAVNLAANPHMNKTVTWTVEPCPEEALKLSNRMRVIPIDPGTAPTFSLLGAEEDRIECGVVITESKEEE